MWGPRRRVLVETPCLSRRLSEDRPRPALMRQGPPRKVNEMKDFLALMLEAKRCANYSRRDGLRIDAARYDAQHDHFHQELKDLLGLDDMIQSVVI